MRLGNDVEYVVFEQLLRTDEAKKRDQPAVDACQEDRCKNIDFSSSEAEERNETVPRERDSERNLRGRGIRV